MHIIVRHATDDFMAWQTAQAMTNAGAEVFSISTCPNNKEFPYKIWAKFKRPVTHEIIDECIDKMFDQGTDPEAE